MVHYSEAGRFGNFSKGSHTPPNRMFFFTHCVNGPWALDPPSPPWFYTIMLRIFSDGLLKSGLQNDTNLQHKFLQHGFDPPPPFTQCVKNIQFGTQWLPLPPCQYKTRSQPAENQLDIYFLEVTASASFSAVGCHQEAFSRSIKSTADISGSSTLSRIHLLFGWLAHINCAPIYIKQTLSSYM